MASKEVKLHIDEALWRRVKVAAATTGITSKDLYTEAITKEVERLEDYHMHKKD